MGSHSWRFLVVLYLTLASSASSTNMDRRPSTSHSIPRVREAVEALEEQQPRSLTGLPVNPNFRVSYRNHPFDRRRRNQENQEPVENPFRPMRIRFETKALDNMRSAETAARIDFLKAEILPRTGDFWSTTLGVVPVDGLLRVDAEELTDRTYCGDMEFTEVPSEHISKGVQDTDLILYVSGTPSDRFCSGTTLAVAVSCNKDQFDRPIAGAINVCLDQIKLNDDGTASDAIIQDNVDVLVHEVGHVLGHSSNSYRFYRDPDTGDPRTPRPFQERTVTCVNGETKSLVLPSESTMAFDVASNGQRYAMIVTPKVQAVARNQFNCQSLKGAKLENQPTGANSCTGDHWDEHDFYPEILSGVISPTTDIVSHLTLALMEDSGWYKANYTQANISPWGLGAGCDFVSEPCLMQSNDPTDSKGTPIIPEHSRGYFCNEQGRKGCSPALTHKMACNVVDYFYRLPRDPPPERFQYFVNDPTFGGPRQADFCPVMGSTYDGRDAEGLACSDPDNDGTLDLYSEKYGEDSQCIETESGDGRCYETRCIKDEMSLWIRIKGEWKVCQSDFQKLNVDVGPFNQPSTLICPRLSTACPDLFCPFNCAGRGRCDFGHTNEDGVIQPKCVCFDESDTSPGCSDSQIPNGDFLQDSTGLFDNLEESFLDPLAAVFVDHPDKWTTASWAWAAGLLTLFLILMLCICSTLWPRKGKTGRKMKVAKEPTEKHPLTVVPSRSKSSTSSSSGEVPYSSTMPRQDPQPPSRVGTYRGGPGHDQEVPPPSLVGNYRGGPGRMQTRSYPATSSYDYARPASPPPAHQMSSPSSLTIVPTRPVASYRRPASPEPLEI